MRERELTKDNDDADAAQYPAFARVHSDRRHDDAEADCDNQTHRETLSVGKLVNLAAKRTQIHGRLPVLNVPERFSCLS